MAGFRKLFELIVLPIVMVVGYAVILIASLALAMAFLAYVGWLIVWNIEGLTLSNVTLDLLTIVALFFLFRSRRLRNQIRDVWHQLTKSF
jgi:hypothetical protein